MKVTIELDDDVINGIADSVALHKGYDRLTQEGVDGDYTEMYAVAFADGMRYLKNLIEQKDND